ncbi:hypothetical protein [Candidatus Tisiphia endosymbiont of Nemotelus uliginosus]|uniref:hypothetical protein n=1 Tax=Candidatus Tisiphia endosymbiont of Nemotelus uliginosus TaxID=3077926 RepID=UPI0035C8AAEC
MFFYGIGVPKDSYFAEFFFELNRKLQGGKCNKLSIGVQAVDKVKAVAKYIKDIGKIPPEIMLSAKNFDAAREFCNKLIGPSQEFIAINKFFAVPSTRGKTILELLTVINDSNYHMMADMPVAIEPISPVVVPLGTITGGDEERHTSYECCPCVIL